MLMNVSYWMERDLKKKKKPSGIPEHNVEWNKPDTNVLCDDICMKFSNGQEKSVMIGVRIMVTWSLEGRDQEKAELGFELGAPAS